MTWEVIDFVVSIFTFADKKEKADKHGSNKPEHNPWPDTLKIFVDRKFW